MPWERWCGSELEGHQRLLDKFIHISGCHERDGVGHPEITRCSECNDEEADTEEKHLPRCLPRSLGGYAVHTRTRVSLKIQVSWPWPKASWGLLIQQTRRKESVEICPMTLTLNWILDWPFYSLQRPKVDLENRRQQVILKNPDYNMHWKETVEQKECGYVCQAQSRILPRLLTGSMNLEELFLEGTVFSAREQRWEQHLIKLSTWNEMLYSKGLFFYACHSTSSTFDSITVEKKIL